MVNVYKIGTSNETQGHIVIWLLAIYTN